jgi:hypothetical protein
MNAGMEKIVILRMDMMNVEDVAVLIWGAMALNDRQVSVAWEMAEALCKAGGERAAVSEDKFFEVIEPFMREIAALDDHLSDFGLNRVLAVLYEGFLTQMEEDLGNSKEELLSEAKTRYSGFEWEFHPPWECPVGQEQK